MTDYIFGSEIADVVVLTAFCTAMFVAMCYTIAGIKVKEDDSE